MPNRTSTFQRIVARFKRCLNTYEEQIYKQNELTFSYACITVFAEVLDDIEQRLERIERALNCDVVTEKSA